jgi:co-chaperonin GroES (HSP10)
MTKHIYKHGEGWTREEDTLLRQSMTVIDHPASLEEIEVPVIDPDRLPFEEIFNNHIIVSVDRYERPKGSKIILPQKAKGNSTKGDVLAIADGNSMGLKIGDKILYSQFAGYLLVFEGLPPLRVIGYDEVLGKLKKNAPEMVYEGS